MCAKNDIINRLREKIEWAAQRGQRGLILQPGAIGDCILTLPLANLMKETVCRGGVDIIGHTEYIGMLPGRSCVDAVKSMDAIDLHRLFASEREFVLADGDPLIFEFAGYPWIVSFLGEADSDFEKNLIFTANCSHSVEVMTFAMKPALGHDGHIADFYRGQFVEQSGFDLATMLGAGKLTASGLADDEPPRTAAGMPLIRPAQADKLRGMGILAENGVMPTTKAIIIHPGSGGAHKCWHLDNFLSVARTLEQEGTDTVFLLGPAEMERFSASDIAAIEEVACLFTDMSLTDVLAVLSCSAGYVGNDSGITHLAAALGIKTIAVFGPTNPAVYSPIGPAVTILTGDSTTFTGAPSEKMQQQIREILLA